jgi:hypothetical protein
MDSSGLPRRGDSGPFAHSCTYNDQEKSARLCAIESPEEGCVEEAKRKMNGQCDRSHVDQHFFLRSIFDEQWPAT